MGTISLVGLDWGTTSVRAYGFDADGGVVAQASSRAGISRQADGPDGYLRTIADLTGAWNCDDVPLLACGMVGSNRGWQEVGYVNLPTDLAAGFRLARLERVGRPAAIVPGLRMPTPPFGVARGEETQALGASTSGARCVIAPGSHSKWIRTDGTRVDEFVTFMTGEVWDALAHHTILASTVTDATSSEGFTRGLELALSPASLGPVSDAFAVRSLSLAGHLPPEQAAELLSGILIGHEVREGTRWLGDTAPVVLCCSAGLGRRYTQALAAVGTTATVVADAAPRGLWHLATSHGLVNERTPA